MKSRGIRNCLEVIGRAQVGIASGDCRVLPNCQARNRLRKCVPEVGVLSTAAVPGPPTRVYRQFHQICQPRLTARATGGTKLMKITVDTRWGNRDPTPTHKPKTEQHTP